WEHAGDIAAAANDCDAALALPGFGEPFAGEASQCIRRIAPRIAVLDVRGAAALEVRVDGGAPLHAPVRRRVAPGHHVLVLADGRGATQRVEADVGAGETRIIDARALFAAAADGASAPASAEPPPRAAAETEPGRGPPT